MACITLRADDSTANCTLLIIPLCIHIQWDIINDLFQLYIQFLSRNNNLLSF